MIEMNDKERITFIVLGTLLKYGKGTNKLSNEYEKPVMLTLMTTKFFSFTNDELRELTHDILEAEQKISIMLKELDIDLKGLQHGER